MSEAIPLVLGQDLATSAHVTAAFAKDESGAYQLRAIEVLRTTIESRQGRTTINATITDLSTQRNRNVFSIEGGSADMLRELNTLAKRIDANASEFSTRSVRALQVFTLAAESPDTRVRAKLLESATGIDPAFGLAYVAAAETSASNAAQILAMGASHRNSFTPFDRARFDALMSRVSRAPLPAQADREAAVLRIAPNDVDALTTLGSVRFLLGDAAAGERSFNRALTLNPGNENIQRRLAEGLFETRRFAEAEKIFARLPAIPPILSELAFCSLLEGDLARANAAAAGFLSSVANPDFNALFHASWLAVSGERQKAIEYLQNVKIGDANLRVIAWSEVAVWQAMASDFANARKSAALAAEQAKQPTPFAIAARLIASCDQPPDQWKEQVNRATPEGQDRQLVAGYGLFLGAHYADAVEIWRKALEQSGGADLRARAMLAASLDHAGRSAEAQKLGVEPFTPDLGDLYAAVSFSQMRRLLH